MKKRGKKKVVNWSDLPPELLLEICKHLEFRLDILRFGSVCKSWKSSLSFTTKPKSKRNKLEPFIIPKPPIMNPFWDLRNSKKFMLTERTLYALHPNKSQINCVGGCGIRGFRGYGDWTCAKIAEFEEIIPNRFIPHHLSKKFTLQSFSKVRNMLDFNVSPISKFYGMVVVQDRDGIGGEVKDTLLGRFIFSTGSLRIVDKVVVMSKYNYYVSIFYPMFSNDDNFLVVAALLRGGQIGLLRLVGFDLTPECLVWRLINYGDDDDESFRFDDIVNLGGRLCVIDYKGRAFLVDLCSLGLTQIAAPPPPISDVEGLQLLPRRKRLVEHCGGLYMLVAFRCQVGGVLRPRIKVYKLREETRDWGEVVSLGDLALFVGSDFSCAASARNIFRNVECNRNCIFFVRSSFPLYSGCTGDLLFEDLCNDHNVGVYDLPNGANFRLAPEGPHAEDYVLPSVLPC